MFFSIYIYCFYTALLEEGRPSLNWSAFTTSAHMVSVDPKDFPCKGFFLRHPCLMSNALTVVSAILSRPYRFSSSNETGVNLKFIKNKLQGILMQVRVNPNWSFKRVTRAWLRTGFAWLIWLPSDRLNGLRYLMPKKRGE